MATESVLPQPFLVENHYEQPTTTDTTTKLQRYFPEIVIQALKTLG